MIRIYVARQRYDAYLVADRLNQAGIRAHVFNQHIADDRDEARARALLGEMERDASRTTPRYCRSCGEQSPGSFDLCWNCGTALT
ncbi:MAG TPA: DUF2007 domain-containing protein [Casimicrobiaceae bacterium]|nr:DUF2007 domain-containing protein [Casimicrobiaceae bacterium]